MSLPNLTIPIELPIDIPVLLHPAIVHFAIAIPIVVLLLEIINIFFKKRALSLFSLFLILVIAVVVVGAYFTGSTDGKETFSALSSAGQAELKEHKLLGTYIVYGSIALIFIKLLFMLFSNIIARLFFVLILIGFTAVTLEQGHDGGDLVYKYGANNQAIEDVKSDKDDLKDELDELQEKYDELKGSVAKSKDEEATKAEDNTTSKSDTTESNSTN